MSHVREYESVCDFNDSITPDELRAQLKKLRDNYRGYDLAKHRYDTLTKIFDQKPLASELKEKLDVPTENVATDLYTYKKIYSDRYALIETYMKRATNYIAKAADKPLQRMLELFVQMACQPVKPDSIDILLRIWLHSAKWNADAKSFANDKLFNHSEFVMGYV